MATASDVMSKLFSFASSLMAQCASQAQRPAIRRRHHRKWSYRLPRQGLVECDRLKRCQFRAWLQESGVRFFWAVILIQRQGVNAALFRAVRPEHDLYMGQIAGGSGKRDGIAQRVSVGPIWGAVVCAEAVTALRASIVTLRTALRGMLMARLSFRPVWE